MKRQMDRFLDEFWWKSVKAKRPVRDILNRWEDWKKDNPPEIDELLEDMDNGSLNVKMVMHPAKIYDIKLHRSFMVEYSNIDFYATKEFLAKENMIVTKLPTHGDSLILHVTPNTYHKVLNELAFVE